jgi:oxidoreductase
VGKALLLQLLSNNSFSKVTVIGRRKLTEKLPSKLLSKLNERIVDFERLEEYASAFEGFDVGFCCLGTTRAKSGAEGFVRVDHDYVLESATLAKRAGCKDFHLVTSQGSNKDSWFLYPQTKGLVEERVSQLGFNRLSIYRPGLLLCEREERRLLEKVLQVIIGTLDRWEILSIPTKSVAQAMLNNVFKNSKSNEPQIEILTHNEIVELSKL